jgi:hypothetical protein
VASEIEDCVAAGGNGLSLQDGLRQVGGSADLGRNHATEVVLDTDRIDHRQLAGAGSPHQDLAPIGPAVDPDGLARTQRFKDELLGKDTQPPPSDP